MALSVKKVKRKGCRNITLDWSYIHSDEWDAVTQTLTLCVVDLYSTSPVHANSYLTLANPLYSDSALK